jgi:hypothetical protein
MLAIVMSATIQVACLAFVSGVQLATRRELRPDQVRKVIKPYIIVSFVAVAVLLLTLSWIFLFDD